jgi:tetratricopeptide (TPR) repeat protein
VSDPAFERYREAIRRGHQAASRGDHDAAIAAFAQAADLAPDRPLPQVGRGMALQRCGRLAEALEAFDRAIQLAPLDEGALRGRGSVLVALGRPSEAAAALTGLAESLEADGRLDEALELGREALALASTAARFRMVARLSAAARSRITDGAAGEARDAEAAGASTGPEAPVPVPLGAQAAAALAEGDVRFEAGDLPGACAQYLVAARLHREDGRPQASLDDCLLALSVAPADADVHLLLAELYRAQGWVGAAVDKLALLARLLDLREDRAAHDRLCQLVAREFAGDPRLAAICP